MCAFLSKLLNVPTEPKATKFRDPIFLIGLMRSGTTLLMNTLSEHPQLLKAGFELNDVWSEVGGAPCSVNCAERTENDFSMEYANNMTAYFTKFIEESKSFKRHMARWSAKRFYGSGAIKYDWDNLYLMNKSPHLSNKIRYIHKMYPNAKFIVIVRDIYGQSASLKMHFENQYNKNGFRYALPTDETFCWSKFNDSDLGSFDENRVYPNSFNVIPEAWIRLNSIIFKHLENVSISQKKIISYEELILNQENTLKSIIQFLNLDSKHQSQTQSIYKRKRKIQNSTTSGDPLKKWKKHLSDEEVEIVNKLIKENKTIYSYIYNQLNLI